MAYAGTAATYGRGRAIVVATGMNTEFGKIARMLETIDVGRTPLQENLDKVGVVLARAALVVVGIIVALGVLRGQPLLEMLVFGIALAVAVVPEALPAVVTISLAIGVQRMVKRHALMRRLPAVETLGSTSVICSDKTGTLTKDQMTIRKIFSAGQMLEVSGGAIRRRASSCAGSVVKPRGPLMQLLQAGVLASDAVSSAMSRMASGRSRAIRRRALVVAASKAGLDKADLDGQFPRVKEIPFTSETKRMTTVHDGAGVVMACSKGAPEVILASCTRQMTEQGESPLDAGSREAIMQAGREMASEALRVLAVASKSGPDAGGPRKRDDVSRDRRDDRPAAAGGQGRDPGLPAGRHPAGDDYRRPPAHRTPLPKNSACSGVAALSSGPNWKR